MPVFFQKIPDSQFDAAGSFVVKESKTMHLVVGSFFLLFSVVAFFSIFWMGLLFAFVAVASLVRSRRNVVIMTIDKTGFFYYGSLVTNWNNFVSARFADELPTLTSSSAGLSDKFYLVIRYYKDKGFDCFERKIALTNTQDKSEEEIFAAINFYYKHSGLASPNVNASR